MSWASREDAASSSRFRVPRMTQAMMARPKIAHTASLRARPRVEWVGKETMRA